MLLRMGAVNRVGGGNNVHIYCCQGVPDLYLLFLNLR